MPEQRRSFFSFAYGNCVRSQMAEAIARHCRPDVIVAESAGLRPLGFIDPDGTRRFEEHGISMDGQFSKGLHSHVLRQAGFDRQYVRRSRSNRFSRTRAFEDWPIADPFGEDMETHRRICDDIEARIKALAERLRSTTRSIRRNRLTQIRICRRTELSGPVAPY